MSELTDVIDRQCEYIEQLRAVQRQAYWLLAWTYQGFLEHDPRDREKGLVSLDRHRGHYNRAEQELLDALKQASVNAPPGEKGE